MLGWDLAENLRVFDRSSCDCTELFTFVPADHTNLLRLQWTLLHAPPDVLVRSPRTPNCSFGLWPCGRAAVWYLLLCFFLFDEVEVGLLVIFCDRASAASY